MGDTRATVLIIEKPVLMRGREGKEGGAKVHSSVRKSV